MQTLRSPWDATPADVASPVPAGGSVATVTPTLAMFVVAAAVAAAVVAAAAVAVGAAAVAAALVAAAAVAVGVAAVAVDAAVASVHAAVDFAAGAEVDAVAPAVALAVALAAAPVVVAADVHELVVVGVPDDWVLQQSLPWAGQWVPIGAEVHERPPWSMSMSILSCRARIFDPYGVAFAVTAAAAAPAAAAVVDFVVQWQQTKQPTWPPPMPEVAESFATKYLRIGQHLDFSYPKYASMDEITDCPPDRK